MAFHDVHEDVQSQKCPCPMFAYVRNQTHASVPLASAHFTMDTKMARAPAITAISDTDHAGKARPCSHLASAAGRVDGMHGGVLQGAGRGGCKGFEGRSNLQQVQVCVCCCCDYLLPSPTSLSDMY